MSRIQQILEKAEREGRMHRTSDLGQPPVERTNHAPLPALDEPLPGHRDAHRPAPAPPAFRPGPPATAAPVVNPILTEARAAVHPRLDRRLIAALAPQSAVAEQYRALRTRISQSENGRAFRTMLVTSPTVGDGKTITAVNLALTMAQESHRRVVLVDADLRSADVHRLLGLPEGPGLAEVLAGQASLEQAMLWLPEYRLTVIPAGKAALQPTELLGSAEMRAIIDTLATQFDRVLLDTPPAAPLADVNVLASLVDGVLLVVRAGHTPRPAIERALADVDPQRIVGLVLNDTGEPPMEYGYGARHQARGNGADPGEGRRPKAAR